MAIQKYGIDVSEWQGNFNFLPYKEQFVIIRGGYGTTLDAKAVRNAQECERLGIPYGVYWYSYALNRVQAAEEAAACLRLLKGKKISVGVWFDMEDADGYKRKHGFSFNKSTISAICNAFCEIIAKEGYFAGIYASRSWFDSYIDCPKYERWVAQWGRNDGKINADTSALGPLLQYTSVPLDKNVSYVNLSYFGGGTPPEKDKLVVDGIFGPLSTTALQSWLGIEVKDGIISGQIKALRGYFPNLITATWEGTGSITVKSLQSYLVNKGYLITVDGLLGAETVLALQKFLIREKHLTDDKIKKDGRGYFKRETAKALQSFLNTR